MAKKEKKESEKLLQFFVAPPKMEKCSTEINHSYRFDAVTMRTLFAPSLTYLRPFNCNKKVRVGVAWDEKMRDEIFRVESGD